MSEQKMRKALEAARQFIRNGIELGYITMPDAETPDPAHDTLPLIESALSTQASAEPVAQEEWRAAVQGLLRIFTEPAGFEGKFGKELDALIEKQQVKIDAEVKRARALLATSAPSNPKRVELTAAVAALQGLMMIESRGRIMPVGPEWDAARAVIAAYEAKQSGGEPCLR